MQDYEKQLERLKLALNVESDTAFSQLLDMSQGSVSGAKKRGQIPHAWFFQVAERTGVSLDWLFKGEGPVRRESFSPAHMAQPSEETTQMISGMKGKMALVENMLQQQNEHSANPKAVQACPQCMELYSKLERANERLYQAGERERAYLEELAELKTELATLKNKLLPGNTVSSIQSA